MRSYVLAMISLAATTALACQTAIPPKKAANPQKKKVYEVTKSDTEWKEQLSPEQYRILRDKGTERAFTGKLNKEYRPGTYTCAGCGQELFVSDHKFDSGSGWPSFYKPSADGRVGEERDVTYGMVRTEIVCTRCGGHLGHVFDDGPKPTGLRYCVNSASLAFTPKDEE